MKAGDIQVELAQTNRWWRGRDWQRDDPDLREAAAAPFDYRPHVLDSLAEGGLYLLRGPRRVGKSVAVKQTIAGLVGAGIPARRILHASVERYRARELRGLVQAGNVHLAPSANGARYWFLDEITAIPDDWPSEIKWLRDNDPAFRNDTVVLTGSSAHRLDETVKALAGRRGDVTGADRVLLPMRFRDFCRTSGLMDPPPQTPKLAVSELASPQAQDAARELMAWLPELLVAWETYLRGGGYPQAVASWVRTREIDPSLIQALLDVIHGEAITSERFAANQTLELLSSLTRSLTNPLNIQNLARDLDIAHTTATRRTQDLIRAYTIWPVHRDEGLRPKLRAQAKHYFIDPLLARLAPLLGRGPEPELGALSEQQTGLALLRALERQTPTGLAAYDRLLFYRSATGAEIDFVGRDLDRLAVESKYVDDKWGRELQTIAASPWHGVLATRGGFEVGRSALVLPTPILVLLLEG